MTDIFQGPTDRPIIAPAKLRGRNLLGILLNRLGLIGLGVEVGTHQGEYAWQLLTRWHGRCLYCVDSYKQPMGTNRVEDERKAKLKLRPWLKEKSAETKRGRSQAKMLTMDSAEACDAFTDGSLDFVYVDANHEFTHVNKDLELWYPKLRKGGMMAGHDFLCPTTLADGWASHIQPAVFNFLSTINWPTLFLISEPDNRNWSYYWIKE